MVAELGNDAIQRIKADPDVLIPLFKKKNDKRIQSIINGIDENDEVDDSIVFFNKLGLGVRNIMKLEVVYGADAAAIIKNNPYQMIEDIDGASVLKPLIKLLTVWALNSIIRIV